MSLFFNSRYELRNGWKFVFFLAVIIPILLGVGIAVRIATRSIADPNDVLHDVALTEIISFMSVVLATLFMARVVENDSLRVVGMGFFRGWARNLLFGFGIAAGLITLVMLVSESVGDASLEWTASRSSPNRMLLTLGMLIIAAAFEEILFRGYPMQVLMRGMGFWPAMILMSCIFGLMHANNANASRLGVFNTIVAGLMLSLAYLKTRSLWLPYGIHLAWNVGTGMVVGFPLSGFGVVSLWTAHISGNPEILGGAYGPEGGLLGTLIFAAGAIAVWKLPIERINYEDRLY
jgi:membrane protease YdiL (CAAX protease family)